jgi:hypothetical protein
VTVKVVFFTVAASAAVGSAVLAGLTVAVIGLSVRMPAATLIALASGAATATFGAVVALAGTAASLFFSTPQVPAPADPGAPPVSQAEQQPAVAPSPAQAKNPGRRTRSRVP